MKQKESNLRKHTVLILKSNLYLQNILSARYNIFEVQCNASRDLKNKTTVYK